MSETSLATTVGARNPHCGLRYAVCCFMRGSSSAIFSFEALGTIGCNETALLMMVLT